MSKTNKAKAKKRAERARKRTLSSRSRKRTILYNQNAAILENLAFAAGLIVSSALSR